jgi:hypothetical protein
MNTDNYRAWQTALKDRDAALYGLLILAAVLVGSYLITYAKWLPPAWGKRLRLAYEIGGALLYIGIIIVCTNG